jgi:transposase-like protein
MNILELSAHLNSDASSMAFLQSRGVLSSHKSCPRCSNGMRLDRELFRCRVDRCETKISIRQNTIFEKSRLSFAKWLLIMHRWSRGATPKELEIDCSISHKTAVNISMKLRHVLYINYDRISLHVCLDGSGKEVEIDESLLSKRKYNRGRAVEPIWVFGAIERATGRYAVELVPNRSEATLLDVITRRIAPGTRIISDMWASYRNLSRHGYDHSTVNHSRYFVSPDDSSVHTNTIEGRWKHTKHFLKFKGTNIRAGLRHYLVECIFRDANADVFSAMLVQISSYQEMQLLEHSDSE